MKTVRKFGFSPMATAEPIEHQHEDGTWHPGLGAPILYRDYTGEWDCDECRDKWIDRQIERQNRRPYKRVFLHSNNLTVERYKDRGWKPDKPSVKLARDEARFKAIAERKERRNRNAPPKKKTLSLEEAIKGAFDKVESQAHLRGETTEWEAA